MFVKDHLNLYLEDRPFYPVIFDGPIQNRSCLEKLLKEGYNTLQITLPCDMNSDLDWSRQIELGTLAKELDLQILWYLDFKLEGLKFSYDHKMQFESLKLGVQTFTSNIYSLFKQNTLGVLFFKGTFSEIAQCFKSEQTSQQGSLLQAADIFVDFIGLFLSSLSDEVIPFIKISTNKSEDKAFIYRLLSKQRFEYFTLITDEKDFYSSSISTQNTEGSLGYFGSSYQKQTDKLPNLGLLFPSDELFENTYEKINEVFESLKNTNEKNLLPRLIYETHLIEEIDGIDQLIVFEKGLSDRGRRQVQGFCAAGGEVLTVGALQGFVSERFFEDFLKENRGRGIRTPDLLVPNQPR